MASNTGFPFAGMGPEHHFRLIWNRRFKVFGTMVAGALVGVVVALMLPEKYESNALIHARAASQLSVLGLSGLGGESASQLTKLEVLLKSRDLAASVHEAYPGFAGRLFPKQWDSVAGTWRKSLSEVPDDRKIVSRIQGSLSVSVSLRKSLIEPSVQTQDPLLSRDILNAYLERLNHRMRETIRRDADSNRVALERELQTAVDPTLIRSLESLIASEMERATRVNAMAFEMIDRPDVPEYRSSPNRRLIVAAGALLGLFVGVAAIYAFLLGGYLRRRFRATENFDL